MLTIYNKWTPTYFEFEREGARHRHQTYLRGTPAKLTNILLYLSNYFASIYKTA